MSTPATDAPTTTSHESQPVGANRVLTWSTTAFTVMFAVWMMFGILQKPIRAELHLSEEQYSWILAAAILNGSMWRLPAGMITDRIGGRKVMTFLLLASAVPAVAGSVQGAPELMQLGRHGLAASHFRLPQR